MISPLKPQPFKKQEKRSFPLKLNAHMTQKPVESKIDNTKEFWQKKRILQKINGLEIRRITKLLANILNYTIIYNFRSQKQKSSFSQ